MCVASQKKSLARLDSTQTDGVNAIPSLEEITGILGKNGNRDDHDSLGGFTAFPSLNTQHKMSFWDGEVWDKKRGG